MPLDSETSRSSLLPSLSPRRRPLLSANATEALQSGSPSRLVRLSLGTSDYVTARHLLADRMAWLLPLQTAQSNQQRYQHIRSQLSAFNGQAPVTDRSKLAARLTFEHVVRGLIDDMGGLKQDGPFNADWMRFC